MRGRVCGRWHLVALLSAAALAGCAPAYSEHAEAVAHSPLPRAQRQAASTIPLPAPALLASPRAPDCDGTPVSADEPDAAAPKVAREASAEPSSSTIAGEPQAAAAAKSPPHPADTGAELAHRVRLEYERECYRRAEKRVRERLRKLQASVSEAVKAVKRPEEGAR
jgi:hypothetical protein